MQVGICFERSILYYPQRRGLHHVWRQENENPHPELRFDEDEYPLFLRDDLDDIVRQEHFNASMEYLWNKTFHPGLPFRVEDLLLIKSLVTI